MNSKSKARCAIAFVVFGALAVPSQACSVCIAHAMGAAIHAIGSQTVPKGTTVIGISYSSFTKSQSEEVMMGKNLRVRPLADGNLIEERHRQSQFDVEVIHGINENTVLRVSIPYIYKSLSMTGEETVRTHGLGDVSLGATYQLKPRPNDRFLIAFTADVKLATGSNSIKDRDGNRLEEHSQIGTGSTDISLGVMATTEVKSGLAFAGFRVRSNGSNSNGYRYGNVAFYNLGYSHKLDKESSMVLELNGRVAGKDKTEGILDDNSGGHFGYLSLSYRRNLGPDFGFVGTYQVPVIRSLNGSQSETGMLSFGVFRKL